MKTPSRFRIIRRFPSPTAEANGPAKLARPLPSTSGDLVTDQNASQAKTAEAAASGPVLLRDEYGAVDYDSLPDVIQWFLDYDQRVAIIKHPKVEELFQWKQEQSRQANEEVFNFNRAEDRLAIGIIQSVAHHPNERELHEWISQMLNALNRASKSTEQTASAYGLDLTDAPSIV